ncbi:unnamed protein product [Auanema sp. JU1783]|nr:unnamed protein product [Auanema sp. JU1783]
MKLLVFITGLFVLVAAQQDDTPPDVLTIYSLITGGEEPRNGKDNYDLSTGNETDILGMPEENSEDFNEPEPRGPPNGAPPMRPSHPKPFGPTESMRRPGPGRFPSGPGRFPFGPGRFPPGPGRFPPGPGGRFFPGPGGRFPPGPRPFPPRPRLECGQWNDWQKASCFWPNQTLDELPYNCRVVPVKDSWPTYLKKFVEAKVVEGFNIIVDEFKRRGAPKLCGFCARSFECRLRNETRSSSRFCPLKEVRPVDEECGDNDACVISEEKGGCPPPLFLHKPDRLDNLRDMIQKKQYKKFAAHLLQMQKSDVDGKPENIRFKRAPGFGNDYSSTDLAFFNQMMEAAMYDGDFNQRDMPFGLGQGSRPSQRFAGSNFDFNGPRRPFNRHGFHQQGFNPYENSMPQRPQRNGPFSHNSQAGSFAAHYPQGPRPYGGPEGSEGRFSPLQDSPFASAGRPGHAGLENRMGSRKQRREQPFEPFEIRRDDEDGFRNTEGLGPKSFGPRPFGPGPHSRFPSPHGPRGPAPFGPRPFGPSNDFPFPQGPEGPRGPAPFGPRPFGPRPFGPSDDFPFPLGPEGPHGRRGPASFGPRPFGPRPFGPGPFGPSDDFPFPQGPEGPRGPSPFGPRPFGPSNDFPFPQGPEGPEGPRGSRGPRGPQGARGPRPFGPSDDFPFPQGQDGSEGPRESLKPRGPQGPRGPRPFGPSDDFPFPQGQDGPEGPREPRRPRGPQGPEGPRGRRGPAGPFGRSDDSPFGDDDVRPSEGKPPMPFDRSLRGMAFGRRFARMPLNGTMNFSNDRHQFEAMKVAMFNHMRFHQQNTENERPGSPDGLIDKDMEMESRMLLANLLHGTTCASVNHTCLCCCNHYVPNVETGKCEDLRKLLPGIEDALDNMDEDESSSRQPARSTAFEMKKKPMNKQNPMQKMEKPSFTSDF